MLLRDVLFYPLGAHVEVELVSAAVMGRPAGGWWFALLDSPVFSVVLPPAAFEERAHEPLLFAGAAITADGEGFG